MLSSVSYSFDAPQADTESRRRFIRRQFLRIGAIWLLLSSSGLAAPQEVDLTAAPRTGQIREVATVVEIRGDLTVNADGREVRRIPMEAKADLRYCEKLLTPPPGVAIRAVRHYGRADAELRIQSSPLRQSLRSDRRLIVVDIRDGLDLFSPSGPLTREELDLIDTSGSSACLDLLVPGRTLPIGESWKLERDAVLQLLSLEAVGEQEITATLTKVEDGLAIIDLSGKVTGAVGGVSTEITLQGKANFHLQRRAVSWLAMQYEEKRSIGHAQPGYEATVRVRVQTEPATTAPELADPGLPEVIAKAHAGRSLLEFQAEKAGISFLQDRRWRVMVDRFDTVIMRLVDRGDLIAQCNITRLPPLEKGEQLSLAVFQQDVQKTLGKNLGQIVEATQSQTEDDLRVLRITVSGTSSEIPIQWLYYHVSDKAGHRASLVFTMESKLVERFAHIDRELVDSLALAPSLLDETKEPKPAIESGGKSARRTEGASQSK